MSSSPSPSTLQLIPLPPQDDQSTTPSWRRIYTDSNAVVLYNPTSHALAVRDQAGERNITPEQRRSETALCPYCKQRIPGSGDQHGQSSQGDQGVGVAIGGTSSTRAPNYFHLLSLANEANSRPPTRPPSPTRRSEQPTEFPSESIAQGYFSTFFKEERRLGMGANGSVYLCQHVLNGNTLGHFAVKKVAIGDSPAYLANLLREVRLLESLHHPNIINYHHAWLESCQFSSFGPPIPTLHILMQWAEGGSLEELIEVRMGRPNLHGTLDSNSMDSPMNSGAEEARSRSARIRAFRKRQGASSQERKEKAQRKKMGTNATPVHLFSAVEIKCIFSNVVNGLGFLHAKSVLHLDLKPLNVLLTWDEGSLIPRAMLSDFGTAQDMLSSYIRSGNTGTLEYCAPESVYRDPSSGGLKPIDSKVDMWSLGMILHKLIFFNLPFSDVRADDFERLEKEILCYSGFKVHPDILANLKRRCIPRTYSVLLESLLNVSPFLRPNCEQIILAINERKLDPLLREYEADDQMVSLVPRKGPPVQHAHTRTPTQPRRRSLEDVQTVENGISEQPSISIESDSAHPAEDDADGSDSDTPTPGGSRSREPGRHGDQEREKSNGDSSPKKSIPLGFLRSSTSVLEPRFKLLGPSSSSSVDAVPPYSVPVFPASGVNAEGITRIVKTLVVLLKVLSLHLLSAGKDPITSSTLIITLSLALPDLWFGSWRVSVYLLGLHISLLAWLSRY